MLPNIRLRTLQSEANSRIQHAHRVIEAWQKVKDAESLGIARAYARNARAEDAETVRREDKRVLAGEIRYMREGLAEAEAQLVADEAEEDDRRARES